MAIENRKFHFGLVVLLAASVEPPWSSDEMEFKFPDAKRSQELAFWAPWLLLGPLLLTSLAVR